MLLFISYLILGLVHLTKQSTSSKCPDYGQDLSCDRHADECYSDDDCYNGKICCQSKCGGICETRADLCPKPKCQGIPDGYCSRDTHTIISGIQCPGCPEIIPCNPDCLLPKCEGPCEGYFRRYYYDVRKRACRKFIYGGCNSNYNNFYSLKECQDECNIRRRITICGEDPTCPPQPPRALGLCPLPCIYKYTKMDGVICKDSCHLGLLPAERDSNGDCPNTCPESQIQEDSMSCPMGNPLDNLGCGLEEDDRKCPVGYFCNTHNSNRYNACCRIPCRFGTPHPTKTCDRYTDFDECPDGYSCLSHPDDDYVACCPDKTVETTLSRNTYMSKDLDKQTVTGTTPAPYTTPSVLTQLQPPPTRHYGANCPIDPSPEAECIPEMKNCKGDDSCPSNQKCCKEGCKRLCLKPTN